MSTEKYKIFLIHICEARLDFRDTKWKIIARLPSQTSKQSRNHEWAEKRTIWVNSAASKEQCSRWRSLKSESGEVWCAWDLLEISSGIKGEGTGLGIICSYAVEHTHDSLIDPERPADRKQFLVLDQDTINWPLYPCLNGSTL